MRNVDSCGRVHRRRRERGMAMLLVLIAVGVAMILALSFLNAQSTATAASQNIVQHARARAVAETGIMTGIAYIQQDADWRSDRSSGQWLANQSFAGGTYDLFGEDEADGDLGNNASDPVTLTAVARVNGRTYSVRAVLTPGSAAGKPLLLVVGDSANPHSDDGLRRTQAQSWGYVVALIDDDASDAAYAAALAAHDVVWVSPTVFSFDATTKLTSAAIGMVVEDRTLWDQLRLSNGYAGGYNGTSINIVNNGHYITQPFNTGNLPILSSTQNMLASAQPLASGAMVLGQRASSSQSALVAINRNGMLISGGLAAGRRVFLPFAGPSGFSFGALNSNGLTLIQRSLQWAQGADTFPGIGVTADIEVKNNAFFDAYDSTLGPYGGSNVSSEASLTTNSTGAGKVKLDNNAKIHGNLLVGLGGNPSTVITGNTSAVTGTIGALDQAIAIAMPSAPTNLGASTGDRTITGTTTISSNLHVNKLEITNDALVHISGQIVILCEGDFVLDNNARIELQPGASLDLYVKGGTLDMKNNSQVNANTADPSRVTLYYLNSANLVLSNNVTFHGKIVAPSSLVEVKNNADVFGAILAKSVKLDNNAKFHQDLALTGIPGGVTGGGSGGGGGSSSSNTYSIRWDEQP